MLTIKQKNFLIEMGAKAPSGGNMQPWRLLFNGDILQISINQDRLSGMLDVYNFASIFALGALYENILQASKSMGFGTNIEGDYKNSKLPVFLVSFFKLKKETNDDLYKYINKRKTIRGLHLGGKLSKKANISVFNSIKEFKNTSLKYVSNKKDVKEVAKILGKGDRLRMCNDVLFSQMMSELRFEKKEIEETRDGIDVATLEMPGNMDQLMRLLKEKPYLRSLLNAEVFEKNANFLISSSYGIGVVSVDNPVSSALLFEAGRAVERMWLTATKLGIGIHPWSVLSFLFLRNNLLNGDGFLLSERKVLKNLEAKFKKIFHLNKKETPIFIFRMLKNNNFTKISLRLNQQGI